MPQPALPTIEDVAKGVLAERAAAKAATPAPVAAAPAPTETEESEQTSEATEDAGQVSEESEEQHSESTEETGQEETPAPVDSKQYLAMLQMQRDLRRQTQELEAKFQDVTKRSTELEARTKEAEAREAEFKKSPYKTLRKAGISLEDVTRDAMNDYEPPKEEITVQDYKQRVSEIETLKGQVADLLKKVEDADVNAQKREIEQARANVMEAIQETIQGEQYEFLQTMGNEGAQLVYSVMEEYYHEYKEPLDYDKACAIVEKHYEDSVVDKLMSTSKAKKKYTSAAPAQSPKKEAKGPPQTLKQSHSTANQATPDLDKLPKDQALAVLARELRFKE